eukprot:g8117.t1
MDQEPGAQAFEALLLLALRKLLRSPAALQRLLALQRVPLARLSFAAPNQAVPKTVRGVWWIDFGPGVVTVDLNRLTAISNFDFYAEDAAPEYQSFSGLAGLRAFLFAKLFSVRSHVHVDADGPQVWWSLGGVLPLPFTSPSKRVGEHVVRRYIKTSFGKTLASYFARRVIDAAGQKTEHFQEMFDRVDNVLVRPGLA